MTSKVLIGSQAQLLLERLNFERRAVSHPLQLEQAIVVQPSGDIVERNVQLKAVESPRFDQGSGPLLFLEVYI